VVKIFLIVLTSCLSLNSAGTVSSAQDLSNGTETVEKEASGNKQEAGDKNPEATVADDSIQTTALVQVSTVSVEFKDDRVVRVNQFSCIDD
jgi:hypothetical protein